MPMNIPQLEAAIYPNQTQSVVVNDTVNFTVSVGGGTPPYAYQWYVGGVPMNGENTTAYSFSSATVGTYHVQCKVTDDDEGMTYTNSVTVQVFEEPVEQPVYCDCSDVMDRMLIDLNDTTYGPSSYNEGTSPLEVAVAEASRTVDIFLMPYTNVPLTGDIDIKIAIFTADFAASIFKRRMMPTELTIKNQLTPEGLNQIEASGWWGIGIKKLEEYIKGHYVMAENLSSVHNAETVTKLWKAGLMTAQQARVMINNDVAEYIKVITDKTETLTTTVTKTLDETKTIDETITTEKSKNDTEVLNETITSDKTLTTDDTKQTYHTRKQKSFSFVEGDPDGEGYKEQEE